mgnify:FL=1
MKNEALYLIGYCYVGLGNLREASKYIERTYRNYKEPFRMSGQAIWASDRPRFSFQGSKYMTRDSGMVIAGDEDYARDICKAAVCGYRILCETGFDEREDWSYQRHG